MEEGLAHSPGARGHSRAQAPARTSRTRPPFRMHILFALSFRKDPHGCGLTDLEL